MTRKGGDILCDHDARFVREQLVSYAGNNVGTKGEGQGEPFFLLVKTRRTNWQSSHPSMVTEIVINNGNRFPDGVVHRGVYISKELTLLR